MFLQVPAVLDTDFHGQKLHLESGLLAQQATASVLASIGETTVMVNVVVGKPTTMDYFPLQVIYEEKMYASGKINGSRFVKREGRPSENSILTGRMIDRSLRSLFDSHIRSEIQVIITVLSLDEINPPDLIGVLAASTALKLATDAFLGPVSSIRVGLSQKHIGDKWVKDVEGELVSSSEFGELKDFLVKVSQSLDAKNETNKNYLREIARKVANRNPEWSSEFSDLYKLTTKLSAKEVQSKYPTERQVLINPSYLAQTESLVDLVVSGDGVNIMMVEAGAQIIDEHEMGHCLDVASEELKFLTAFQTEFLKIAQAKGLVKNIPVTAVTPDPKYKNYWESFLGELEVGLYLQGTKDERNQAMKEFKDRHFSNFKALGTLQKKEKFVTIDEIRSYLILHAKDVIHPEVSDIVGEKGMNLEIAQTILSLVEDDLSGLDSVQKEVEAALEEVIKEMVKAKILEEEKRLDGRRIDEVRKITCQVDVLPRVHGSSLFQRGETQVLNILTLGTLRDAQTLDNMEDFEEGSKRYIHHYNFPSYSVGETGRYGSPGRREIGHGALAEKALLPVLPTEEEFPYTIRLVSECLGSNGSTSMASTCSSTMSLLAAGVPIKDMVAGVAMGLVLNTETGDFKVLTDIQGAEDHNGDMDFKVTGTADGITAIQLDNKVAGLTAKILKQALIEAKSGRLHILGKMQEVITKPRENIAATAPGVTIIDIPFEKIGEVIGPSGKNIKALIAQYEVEIDIADDSGKTYIYSKNQANSEAAKNAILAIVKDFEAGDEVQGRIFRIEAYGAFVKIMIDGQETPKEGLIHISNLAARRLKTVDEVVKIGDVLDCKVFEVNDKGQIGLVLKTKF
ncbi:MAG: polyribonucleotide nucleotidyltransferase [bacterium]